MRIPSGSTDRYIYFVAVDSTDLKTRETGLTTFTVYRSRNGGAAAAMTTPTINEVDATNMPGVYELLLDEDTTLTAGNDTEEMAFHITQASMAPVTRVIEIYRPETTEGNTLDVTSTGAGGIDWGNIENKTTANNLSATDIQTVGSVSGSVGSVAGNVDGSVGSIVGVTFPSNFGDLSISVTTGYVQINEDGSSYTAIPWNADWDAEVESEVNDGLVALGLDHLVGAAVIGTDIVDNSIIAKIVSASATADWDDFVNTTDSLQAIRDNQGGAAPTAAAIADAVWDEAQADHVAAGSFGLIASEIADILVDTNDLQTNQGNWLTATGFSTHSAADVWTAVSRTLTAATNITSDASAINVTAGVVDTVTTLTNLPAITSNWLTAAGIAASALNGKGDWATQANVATEISDALTVDTPVAGVTIVEAIRRTGAVVCYKLSGAGTGTETVTDWADSAATIVFTVDGSGNKTAVTFN